MYVKMAPESSGPRHRSSTATGALRDVPNGVDATLPRAPSKWCRISSVAALSLACFSAATVRVVVLRRGGSTTGSSDRPKPRDGRPGRTSPPTRHEALPPADSDFPPGTVGWNLPGVDRSFYHGDGVGPSFGPPLKLPSPVLVVGMPKCGTTSIRDFFRCNGRNASHWRCPDGSDAADAAAATTTTRAKRKKPKRRGSNAVYCGVRIWNNVRKGLPPLLRTGNFDVYAQMDAELSPETSLAMVPSGTTKEETWCYVPQVHALRQIHEHYPNATFLLNVRPVGHWIASLRRFLGFDRILSDCDLPGFPSPNGGAAGGTDEEFRKFYLSHSERIRKFAEERPSHALVEIDIEDPKAGKVLADAFGLSEECWVKRNAGAKEVDGRRGVPGKKV